MSLRLRLILAFFALAVVPLAAMTWYTYASNERALRDAAEHESDMLAGELTQRMQLITTQLSDRVDRLMDLDAGTTDTRPSAATLAKNDTSAATARPDTASAADRPAAPSSNPSPAAAPTVTVNIDSAIGPGLQAEVAESLGDAAMLLNNVEIRGLPPDFSRFSRGRRGGSSSSADSSPSGNSQAPRPVPTPRSTTAPRSSPNTTRGLAPGTIPPAPVGPAAPATEGGTPSAGPSEGNAPTPPQAPSVANVNGDRITIDLSRLRREMFQEIAPGRTFEDMDAAERLRIIGEINQRILGIRQGLRLGAAELQRQADEAAKRAVDESNGSAASAAASSSAGATSSSPSGSSTASANAVAPTTGAAPPTSASASNAQPPTARRPSSTASAAPSTAAARSSASRNTATRRGALSGSTLNVRREQNGVVRQVNAEVNLPDLLAMVFSATPRDRGEVPFALDKSGRIYAPTSNDRKLVAELGGGATDYNHQGAVQLPEWIVVTTPDPTGSGLKFGIARPVGQALGDIRQTAVRSAGLGLLFICGTLILIVPLSAGLTRSLSRLNAGVQQIASGDYATRVSVTAKDEIGQLAVAFNHMAEDVEKHQRTAIGQERIKRELELGREIQADMLPRAPLHVGGTEVRGTSAAAREVGGDFFNYFPLKDGRLAVLVGDVAGKGVGAALLMANLQASLRTRLVLGQDLTSLANELDRDIQSSTPETVYATLFVGTFDPATRALTFVNAGHNPQYVIRRSGSLERLESSGLPVGLLAGRGYCEGTTTLEAGDVLFCYTDGCVEAENRAGDMFGSDALERELQTVGALDPEPLLRHMEGVLQRFRSGRELFDDATMMVLRAG